MGNDAVVLRGLGFRTGGFVVSFLVMSSRYARADVGGAITNVRSFDPWGGR